jgi:hypothetical protein
MKAQQDLMHSGLPRSTIGTRSARFFLVRKTVPSDDQEDESSEVGLRHRQKHIRSVIVDSDWQLTIVRRKPPVWLDVR